MKKLLFLIMMIVAGNAFTAGTQANEDMAIKRALQSRLNSFFFTIVNEGIRDNERNLEKEAYSKLFKKDYIISNSLKREIVEKYAREISRITADETKLKFDVKQIDYLSNGEAEVVYDIKSKSLKSVPDMLEVDDETERRILERAKMTESELEGFIRILHLIDLVKSKEIKDKLTEEEFKEATSSKFPITILERFFSNKLVKDQWGIEFEGTDLKLKNKSSFFDAYSALIKNIVSTDDSRIAIDTRTITSNLEEILKKLPKVDLEEQEECTITRDTQEQESTIKTKTPVQNTNKPIVTNDPNRKQLIPPIYQLTSSDFRLNGLFDELKQLSPKYINVKAASLRIFLDLAVLNYIQSLGIEEKIKEMYKCNLRDVSLGRRLEYLKTNNLTANSKNIVTKLLDDSAKYTLSILNGYIHGKDTHYLDKQFLNGFWDFLFPLFCEILDIKESK